MMSKPEVDRIRRDLLEIQQANSSRRRYPQELREAVVLYARYRRSEGATLKMVCRELGLLHGTLHKWLRSVGEKFLPVKVSEVVETKSRTAARSRVLTTPRGYRVDGLDVDELLFLLHHLDR